MELQRGFGTSPEAVGRAGREVQGVAAARWDGAGMSTSGGME